MAINPHSPRALPDVLRTHLRAGEQLLWHSQPRQGLVLRTADTWMIPFGILWGGFAISWEWSVLHSQAPHIFVLWGLPFVLIGIYISVGRFFFDAHARAHTHYAVTSERVLIASRSLTGRAKVQSLSLRGLSAISLTEQANGRGVIDLSGGHGGWWGQAQAHSWMNPRSQGGPQFEGIENARQVFDLIQTAQRSA